METTVKKIMVTPEMASKFLENNEGNRQIVKERVEYYVTEIREGRWNEHSNDMICISPTGRLLNGQHRLSAIVAADVVAGLTVQYNTPESAFSIMDTGTKRSAANYFDWCGITNAHTIPACAVRVLLWLKEGIPSSSRRSPFANQVLLDHYNEYSTRYQSSATIASYISTITPLSVAMACVWMLLNKGHSVNDVRQFFIEASPTYTGSATDGNAARALCATLTRARLQGIKRTDRHTLALIIKAWNVWIKGNKLGQLRWIDGEAFPIIQ